MDTWPRGEDSGERRDAVGARGITTGSGLVALRRGAGASTTETELRRPSACVTAEFGADGGIGRDKESRGGLTGVYAGGVGGCPETELFRSSLNECSDKRWSEEEL